MFSQPGPRCSFWSKIEKYKHNISRIYCYTVGINFGAVTRWWASTFCSVRTNVSHLHLLPPHYARASGVNLPAIQCDGGIQHDRGARSLTYRQYRRLLTWYDVLPPDRGAVWWLTRAFISRSYLLFSPNYSLETRQHVGEFIMQENFALNWKQK